MTENKQALPGHETQSSEMNCPSCGRFVGAVTKCPYCGAKVEKRMSLTATRWAAVLLATIGLFLLWLMAVKRDVPVVKLGDIQPTMNFAQIRLEGEVKTDARPFRTGMGMSFHFTDGTGAVIVFITKKQMDEMIENNLTPKAGDQVSFIGSLNVSDDQMSMRLLSVKEFHLTRAVAESVQLADITKKLKGSAITIAGTVTKLEVPPEESKRPYALQLKDASGEQVVNFWQAEYEQIENPDALPGANVRLRVNVGTYRDKVQLTLGSGLDLEILDGPPATDDSRTPAQQAAETYRKKAPPRDFSRGRAATAEAIPLSDITADKKGHTVRVQARVASVTPPQPDSKQPFAVLLRDGDTSLRVTYWSNVDERIADKPVPGALFEMEGVVDVFRDRPQLTVESGYKVRQVEAAPAAPEPVAIASISAADKGQIRTIEGTLGAARDLGKGTAYTLTDDSGAIDLILWHSTVPADVRTPLAEGQTVAATGTIGEYDGQLQLKANAGPSVYILR
ncbi:MAG: OB-fold nucleic acid binding domain-containing protein [Kiritimatiellae bacterium]|jgi:DNA/RNA endonuclease YhcR with UshA esterase domain|nr:OB-fold nucleic acid binding domain-containing protein [Kiritimatiellia bacterium]MDD4341925.1 OB-fold nucleic acid binding domain-containing protein [Kiritimatiellia bacterium]MDY0149139.1 OB-fold nucleic acid binding domain-containing protein [Kiritimatiellia bacterium]